MLKLTTGQRNRANKMLYAILYSEVYCCFPSLHDKSREWVDERLKEDGYDKYVR